MIDIDGNEAVEVVKAPLLLTLEIRDKCFILSDGKGEYHCGTFCEAIHVIRDYRIFKADYNRFVEIKHKLDFNHEQRI